MRHACVHFSTPDIHERKGMTPCMHYGIAANITPLHLPGLVPPQARVDKEDIPGITRHRTRHALLDRDADASLEFLRHAKVPHLTATHLHMPGSNTNGGIVRWHYECGIHAYIAYYISHHVPSCVIASVCSFLPFMGVASGFVLLPTKNHTVLACDHVLLVSVELLIKLGC